MCHRKIRGRQGSLLERLYLLLPAGWPQRLPCAPLEEDCGLSHSQPEIPEDGKGGANMGGWCGDLGCSPVLAALILWDEKAGASSAPGWWRIECGYMGTQGWGRGEQGRHPHPHSTAGVERSTQEQRKQTPHPVCG